ncbi:MAG: dienelactone hydrolase family protein, partial [Sphingomonas sp.]
MPLTHDGVALAGELYGADDGAPRPGVLVMHHGLGLGRQARAAAERLAALGHVALASDMYGDFGGDPARAGAHFEALRTDPSRLRARAVAWHAALRALPGVDP